jgi:hypothetical protein
MLLTGYKELAAGNKQENRDKGGDPSMEAVSKNR